MAHIPKRYRWLSWFCFFFIGILIFYISSLNFGNYVPDQSTSWKAMAYHFGIFFLFAFFLFISINERKTKYLLIGIAFSILYAISDEVHQFLVPGRAMSLNDIFIDTLGILLATALHKTLPTPLPTK